MIKKEEIQKKKDIKKKIEIEKDKEKKIETEIKTKIEIEIEDLIHVPLSHDIDKNQGQDQGTYKIIIILIPVYFIN